VPSTEKNIFNEKVKDKYTIYGFRMAMATFNGGNESIQARQLVGNNDVVFTIPWEPNVTQLMVVRYNGMYYDVKGIAEEGRCVKLHLSCSTRDRSQPVTLV
jgi:SPP1 family predicted phage head-tail adaptor